MTMIEWFSALLLIAAILMLGVFVAYTLFSQTDED